MNRFIVGLGSVGQADWAEQLANFTRQRLADDFSWQDAVMAKSIGGFTVNTAV